MFVTAYTEEIPSSKAQFKSTQNFIRYPDELTDTSGVDEDDEDEDDDGFSLLFVTDHNKSFSGNLSANSL